MNAKKKQWILIFTSLLFIISALAMFYYGYKTFYVQNDKNESSSYSYHFAMIGEETGDPYWDEIYQGALAAAEEENIKLEYIAPKKADDTEALSLLDRMISAKVDGIMTYGIAGQRFVELMLKASERGLPVITIETDIKASARRTFIGIDNEAIGQEIGKEILNKKNKTAQIAVIVSNPNVQSQKERLEGLKSILNQKGAQAQLLTVENSGFSAIGAASATYNIFKTYPEVTDIVSLNALDGPGIIDGMNDIVLKNKVDIYSFPNENMENNKVSKNISITEIKYDRRLLGREAMNTLKAFQEEKQLQVDELIDFEMVSKSEQVVE